MSYLMRTLLGRVYRAQLEDDGSDLDGMDDGSVLPGDEDSVEAEAEAEVEAEVEAKDDDDEGEAEAEQEKVELKKSPMIPKARFDEVRNKAKAREAELMQEIERLSIEQKKAVEDTAVSEMEAKIVELEEKYQQMLDDGKNAEAAQTMREIRQLERKVILNEASAKSAAARAEAVEEVKMDTYIDQLEEKYPQLKAGSKNFDQETVELIQAKRMYNRQRGMTPYKALVDAATSVLGRVVRDTAQEEKEPKEEGLRPDNTRSKEQLRKNLDVAGKQPPKLKGGLDSHKKGGGIEPKNVMEMSEDELEALPASTLARLRGDYIDEAAA